MSDKDKYLQWKKDHRLSAAKKGDIERISACLKTGASLSAADEDGNTGLHWAAARGHVGAVKLFLTAGLSPTVKANKVACFGSSG